MVHSGKDSEAKEIFMYILFDIGGTNTRIAASKDGASFGEPVIFSTPKEFDRGVKLLTAHAREFAQGENITMAVGGVAGTLTRDKGTLIAAPNLPAWVGNPLRGKLQEILGVPVHVENDAAMVGLGEAVFGAGKGFPIVAYLTISTGVGGARIVEGIIDEADRGFEPGHQIIDPDNTLCPECEGNDLESYVSGTAVAKRYGIKPHELHDPKTWDTLAKYLAYGVHNTIMYWSPSAVVLGGSMMKKIGIPLPAVTRHLKEISPLHAIVPELRKAELEDLGGLWGALAQIKNLSAS